jgi:hypothetical protein
VTPGDFQLRPGAAVREQADHVRAVHGDAAGGRGEIRRGQVEEDRAAETRAGRIVVVAQHDHQS